MLVKFKGKRKDNGKWITDSETYIHDGDGIWLSDESLDVVLVDSSTVSIHLVSGNHELLKLAERVDILETSLQNVLNNEKSPDNSDNQPTWTRKEVEIAFKKWVTTLSVFVTSFSVCNHEKMCTIDFLSELDSLKKEIKTFGNIVKLSSEPVKEIKTLMFTYDGVIAAFRSAVEKDRKHGTVYLKESTFCQELLHTPIVQLPPTWTREEIKKVYNDWYIHRYNWGVGIDENLLNESSFFDELDKIKEVKDGKE
jgi:hypothetical protein